MCIWRRARSHPTLWSAKSTRGFYVTDLIGMGANIITGDYSRGAPGSGSKMASAVTR